MKEASRFLPFLPDFSSFSRFFLIFSRFFLIFPDFWQIFAVRGGTLPPCHPSGYATGKTLFVFLTNPGENTTNKLKFWKRSFPGHIF